MILTNLQAMILKSNFFKKVKYYPHKFQAEFHNSSARFRAVIAGSRGGKSMCAGAEAAPFLMIPDFRIWIVSSTYDLAEKEFTWILNFLGEYKLSNGKRLIDYAKVGNAARGSRYIKMPWGAFVETKSTKTPESLLGEEVDLIILGEASTVPKTIYDRYLRRAIGSRHGRVIAPSTPNSDGGLLMEFCKNGESEDPQFSDWACCRFATIDNPTFSREEYEEARKELPTKVFQEQYEGKFVSRKGKVLESFGDMHIINELPEGYENWSVFRTIHHEANAFNNPFVCLWIAIEPETRKLYVIDEMYSEKALIDDEAKIILEKSRGKKIITTMIDYFNPGIKEILKKFFKVKTNTEKKFNKRFATVKRIQALQMALKLKDDGKPDIYILSRCENTIRELNSWKWPSEKKEGTDLAEVEIPTTKNNSCPLAISYVIAFTYISMGRDIYSLQGLIQRKRAS